MAHNQYINAEGSVGARLRRVLAFIGLSLRDFAKRTGIPYRTLQDYVANLRGPGAEHLTRMADAGLDVHWLLTGRLKPPIRLEYPGDDWPELAEKVGAFGPAMQTDLFDLAFELAEQFAGRFQQRHGRSLTIRESFSAFVFFHWMVLRSAARVAPLVAAATKAPPKAADLRAMITATITPDSDSAAESNLRRLLL